MSIKSITLKNGQEKYISPYYTNDFAFNSNVFIKIHIYKEVDSDCRHVLIVTKELPHLCQKFTPYDYNHGIVLTGEQVKRYYYSPENYIKDYTYRPLEFVATISLSDAHVIEKMFKVYDKHVFYFETSTLQSSNNSNSLIHVYIAAFYETWRMTKYGSENVHFNIYKVCDTCMGTTQVYYTTGKRRIKKIVRKCPQCKGKNSFEVVI